MACTRDECATSDTLRQYVDRLFDEVDVNKDGHLDVKEVAALFQQLAPDQDTHSAYNAAVEALLLTDANVDAKLSRQEFYQLLIKVSELAGVPASTAVQRLLTATQPDASPSAAAGLKAIYSAPESAVSKHTAKIREDFLLDSKLQALFSAWDRTGDGSISFEELCQGLARFKPHLGKQDITALISEAASILAKHDTNRDRRLQYDEFTTFLTRYMHAGGYSLTEVLDELMQVAQRPDSRRLQAVLDSAQSQIEDTLSKVQQPSE